MPVLSQPDQLVNVKIHKSKEEQQWAIVFRPLRCHKNLGNHVTYTSLQIHSADDKCLILFNISLTKVKVN